MAEPQVRAQSEAPSPEGEVGAGDDFRASRGEGADARARGRPPQVLRHHEAEHGVAEEGERLVVGRARVLVGIGAMGQRVEEEIAILELVTEGGPEGPERIRRSVYGAYFRKTRVALVPPNPKALLIATSTSCLRAWLGT